LKAFNPDNTPISLYIHLPWCEKKCPYCDFNINVNKSSGDEEKLLEALFKDLSFSKKYILNRKFSSIYFGGGTPSLVSPKIIERLITKLSNERLIKDHCEISFELNPKEVSKEYLNNITNIGINRISIGIQSFDQIVLDSLERNHNAQQSLIAMETVAEFEKLETSIDLIYGVMEQSQSSLQNDLETFCKYNFNHLSLYQLTIEPNTIFYKRELKIPSDEIIESMELMAKRTLNQNEIYQYEVSSWAKNNMHSKHNMNYWMYGDYLGIGPGAHSKITTSESILRMIKLKKVDSYFKDPTKNIITKIDESKYDLDLAMNLLRIKNGISFKEAKKRNIFISKQFNQKVVTGIEAGLLEKDLFKATPKGYKFLNDTINLFN
jgi:putative oxygen-independent coproporphyrinogen III oxidase